MKRKRSFATDLMLPLQKRIPENKYLLNSKLSFMNISKNNCIDFITSVGRENSIGNPIEGKDLRDAKIEIQYFFSVQTNSGSPYSITFKLYHTNCIMLVQTYSKNKDTCLTDGRFPARAFCEDYLTSVIQLIEKHVNIVS